MPGKYALWGWKGRPGNVSGCLCCSCWGTEVLGKAHTPLWRNRVFLPSGSYPSKTCKLCWWVLACLDPLPRGHRPPPTTLVNFRAGAGTQAGRDGVKETKLPSTGPLKIITAFSKADFAWCQGKNCLSRHLSVLVKKQKACQGRAGPQDREGFLRGAG